MGDKKYFVSAISKSSGLKKSTVRDLLKTGWSYNTGLNIPRQWIGPEAQMKDVGK